MGRYDDAELADAAMAEHDECVAEQVGQVETARRVAWAARRRQHEIDDEPMWAEREAEFYAEWVPE